MSDDTPPRRRGRRLSGEELDLWRHVTRHVTRHGERKGTRQNGSHHPVLRLSAQPRPAPVAENPPPAAPAAKATPPRTYEAAPYVPPVSRPAPPMPPLAPIERRLRQRVSRGSTDIDASIDLHGMRQAQAHSALRGFLVHAQAQGARLVLVVTGKGGGAASGDAERGVLRRAVPQWLRDSEWRHLVIGFEEAARGHGGSGALYVRIRRG